MMSVKLNFQARLLLSASLIGSFAEGMFTPIYAIFTQRVGGSLIDAGIGFALFSVTNGSIVALVGTTDWFQRHARGLLVGGFLLSGLANVGYIFVHNQYQLFVVQATVGLALGIANPAWDGLYSEDVDKANVTRKWSVWTGGIAIVTGIAALIGAFIAVHYGFTALFASMAIIDSFATYFAAKMFLIADTDTYDAASAI